MFAELCSATAKIENFCMPTKNLWFFVAEEISFTQV
jgi:hypothetical protein